MEEIKTVKDFLDERKEMFDSMSWVFCNTHSWQGHLKGVCDKCRREEALNKKEMFYEE